MSKRAFISGHLDLTEKEFEVHYVPQIEKAILDGHDFVIGDARGADKMAQDYLLNRNGIVTRVNLITIYHMFTSPRFNLGNWPTVGGFTTDEARDTAMTKSSDYDIAWVRIGREKSGTAQNLARRQNTLIGELA